MVERVNYFTARVSSSPSDPTKANRQDAYIRALKTLPETRIFEGHYLRHVVRMPYAHYSGVGARTVEVIKTEEKGSDVNLAVQMLNDAWLDNFDCAIVISNDSDLAESLRLIKVHHPTKSIGVFTPERMKTSKQLQAHADFTRTIRTSAIQAAQFPDTIAGTKIRKPSDW